MQPPVARLPLGPVASLIRKMRSTGVPDPGGGETAVGPGDNGGAAQGGRMVQHVSRNYLIRVHPPPSRTIMRPKHLPTATLAVAFGVALWLASALLSASSASEGDHSRKPEPPKALSELTAGYQGNPRYTPVVDLVKRVRGCVVNIHSERTVAGPGPRRYSPTPAPRRPGQRHGHRHPHRPAATSSPTSTSSRMSRSSASAWPTAHRQRPHRGPRSGVRSGPAQDRHGPATAE